VPSMVGIRPRIRCASDEDPYPEMRAVSVVFFLYRTLCYDWRSTNCLPLSNTVFVRPALARQLQPNPFHRAFVAQPSTMSSSAFPFTSPSPVDAESRHHAICPYTGFSPTRNQRSNCNQSAPTVLFVPHPSTRSSSSFHLRTSIQPVNALRSRHYAICIDTAFLCDLEPARQFKPIPCHRAFVPPSA
jgi:hypothetical protein